MGTERIEPAALVALVGGWSDGGGPLYRQLADALARVIEGGELRPGAGLPAERALADALPAARGTVVAALRLLADDGLIERRQGSGTTVAGLRSGERAPRVPAAGLRAQSLTGRAIRDGLPGRGSASGTIGLGLSVLDDPASLPAGAFATDPATLGRASGHHGYAPLGIPALRDRIAGLLTEWGVPSEASEVAITLGVQHGTTLAAEAVAGPGERVALEDPTYPGAIDVYSRAGLELSPVRVDAAGTDPVSLRSVLDREAVRLVHLAPQCASPTGVTTAAHRLDEIAGLLAGRDVWLVEDAALQFLVPPEGQRFLTSARPDRSILLGTASKVFWGGLRVGWLRAPAAVVERIGRLRAAHDLGSPVAPQVTTLRLLDELDEIGRRRRDEAAQRRAHLCARLGEVPGVAVDPPDGGLSLWVRVPDGPAVAAEAARRGLDVLAGPVCSITNGCQDRIRISAWAPLDVLDAAVDRLADAVAAVTSRGGTARGGGPPR